MNLREAYLSLTANYWFLPGLMTGTGLIAGLLAGMADGWFNAAELLNNLGLMRVSAEGARSILSTAAASMITVAGVIFSITIVAIATVTSQFGSRVFSNFMEDRGSQIALGIFLGTFVYCLVVLAWVRASDGARGQFVPQLGITLAMLLVLLSVAAFIYIIRHIADSLRIQTQINAIGWRLRQAVLERFTEDGATPCAPPVEPEWDRDHDIACIHPGYVRRINHAALIAAAKRADSALHVLVEPGDFVLGGQPLVRGCGQTLQAQEIQAAFKFGPTRSAEQDITYYLDQLVEIAVRALSPGINDPFTAGNCVDWLSDGMLALSDRQLPGPVLNDDAGTPRLFRKPMKFDVVVDATVGQLMPYFAADRNAALQLMEAMARCYHSSHGPRREAFAKHARKLHEAAKRHLDDDAIAMLGRRVEGLKGSDVDEENDEQTPRAG